MTDDIFNSADADQVLASEVENLKARFTKDGVLDVEGLLKAKAHADKHIKQVETERAGLYEDLKVRTKLEDLVSKIKETPVNHEPQINSNATPLSEEDIERKLNEKLSIRDREYTYQQNVNKVVGELTKIYGNDWQNKVAARARELGETTEYLTELAKTRPQLLLKLVAGDERSVYNPAPPSNEFRTTSQQPSGKTWSSFERMRKENPSAYWSIETQRELHKLADEYAAKGVDFRKT